MRCRSLLLLTTILAACSPVADSTSPTTIVDEVAVSEWQAPPRISGGALSTPAERAAVGHNVVRRGSGTFVAEKDGKVTSDEWATPERDVTINFIDADIRDVVRGVLGKTLQENVVIHPAVKGTVTLDISRPISRAELLAALEKALATSGAALIRGEAGWEVVPMAQAAASAGRGGRSAGFGSQTVQLRHAAAGEMAKVLEPIAKEGASVSVDTARNVLMLSGTLAQRKAMLDLIDSFDVDWLRGMSFGLYPVRTANVEELATEMEAIFQTEKGPLAGMVRLVPIRRLNSILVISVKAKLLDEAHYWINQLDRGMDQQKRRLYIHYVENGDAATLAAVLQQAFGAEAPQQQPSATLAPGRTPATIATQTSAAASTGGSSSSSSSSGRTQTKPDADMRTGGAQTPSIIAQASSPSTSSMGDGIRFIADPRTNSLVIHATADEFETIRDALDRLDIVPLQVMLEAVIAEVTLTKELSYGVQWFFESGMSSFSLTKVSTGAVAATFPGFNYVAAADNIQVVLSALDQITDVKVVSAPQLMVLDNHTARLQVGDEVPITVQSASLLQDSSAIVNSVEYRDTGVILEVKPRVNSGGLVIMEVRQEVSDVTRTVTSDLDTPTIQQRVIESTVAVQSGETVALGGLIRDNGSKSTSGLPGLSSIPLLGALFGTNSEISDRTELLVLITPRVIGSAQQARDVTAELRGRMRNILPLAAKTR